jgi:predicted dinucleotide-binding enzyme
MNVTIFGTGNMARAIGTRVLAGGHGLTVLGTSREKAEGLADEIRGAAPAGAAVSAGTSGDPIDADVVVLAVWYAAAAPIVAGYGDALSGKIVVDITNPVDPQTYDRLVTPPDSSAAQEIQAASSGARVVKAFNTTFAGTLAAGEVAGQPLDVLIAGDDAEAKAAVARLVEDGGLRAIDAGPLARARELEAVGFLHMGVQGALGTGYGSAVKFIA